MECLFFVRKDEVARYGLFRRSGMLLGQERAKHVTHLTSLHSLEKFATSLLQVIKRSMKAYPASNACSRARSLTSFVPNTSF